MLQKRERLKTYTTLSSIQHELLQGKITCQHLAEDYLQRIEKNKHLNAYLEVFATETIAKAKLIDQKIANKEKLGRLFGCMLGIKDVICYKNHKVGAASKILENFESLYTATALERLLAEDAIILGRLNCDEFAMGGSNENSAYGAVRNAYDNSKVAGGSSGGSSVAVQANLCLAALGSDTGGSVRQPAAFCDVIGLKPTYGRISRHGLIAYASSFDQIGTLTQSTKDAAILLEIMAGKDRFDSTSSNEKVAAFSEMRPFEQKAKIAYFKEALNADGLDEEIKQETQRLLNQLKAAGHEVVAVDFPYLKYIVATYYVLTTAEASSNLSRYDGIHFGYRNKEAKNMDMTYKKSRSEGFGKEVKKRIMLGAFVLSAGSYNAYYAKAQKVRRLIYEETCNIFQDFDFIVMPTTPTTAPEIGAKDKQDAVSVYLADIFTVHPNLAGMPAMSLPLFQHSNSMPYGFQIVANKFEEAKMLSFADYLMRNFGK